MANPDNFWKPGESGNPNGRPKESESWAAIVKRIGQESSPKDPKKTRKEKATDAAYEQAERGNYKAWAALAAREDGQPVQPIDHSGEIKTGIITTDPKLAAIVADAEARLKQELLKLKE